MGRPTGRVSRDSFELPPRSKTVVCAAFLFDLDMTLVDSAALEPWRQQQLWTHVRTNIGLVKAFVQFPIAPHQIPARLKKLGHRVAIITSSPRWYAEQILESFQIAQDVLITYSDTDRHKPDPEPLNAALQALPADSSEAYHVGDATIDVEASYHAGITSIGAGWGVQNFDAICSTAPDVLFLKPSLLLNFDPGSRGYFAELAADGIKPRVHAGSILPCGGIPIRYALGRYFVREDPRHAASALSNRILDLKNDDGPAIAFAQALANSLKMLDWRPDFIVPVPPKPSQTRHRFEALLSHAEGSFAEETTVYLDGLKCVKEITGYKSMGAVERAAAVRGAFTSNYTWNDGSVLLLDDVLTTGETVSECARALLANGASEVRVVALGKDQQVFVRKFCEACGRPMRVRTERATGEKFWGCSGYPNYCRHTESMS